MKGTLVWVGALTVVAAAPVQAQTFSAEDPVLQRIWTEGMENSHVYPLAQTLMDSIGPRLTGTPQQRAAHDWAVAKYARWGIPARSEQYGSWVGWRRAPRTSTSWSRG